MTTFLALTLDFATSSLDFSLLGFVQANKLCIFYDILDGQISRYEQKSRVRWREDEQGGRRSERLGVSHCYEREVFEEWPYNLFAMMHARSMGEIQHAINRFVEAEGIESFELLPTAAELKKQPVRHQLE